MKIKKIISIVMVVAMILSISVISVSASSIERTLSQNKDMGTGMYLNKGETVQISISQTEELILTDADTEYNTGYYRVGFGFKGYKSKLALSVNNGGPNAKCQLYKTFTMYNGYKTYTFKAKQSGMYYFCLRNITKVSRDMRVCQYPSYKLSVY